MNHVVIMAGGVGSRFWPLSTPELPKQFLDILGCGKSLIQLTVDRFRTLCPMENFWVVTNSRYSGTVREQLPGVPQSHILEEPVGRNTAPCIAWACWAIVKEDPDAIIAVTPSDAFIADTDSFREAVSDALEYAVGNDCLLTVGISPTRAETGYGYIRREEEVSARIARVSSFREKPSAAVAQEYIKDKAYLWNAGIFVWSADSIVKAIRKYVPELALRMDEISAGGDVCSIFPQCESISVDYAVMEAAASDGVVFTRPVECGWTDLGNWTSLWEKRKKDEFGNSLDGNVHIADSRDCIVSVRGLEKAVVQGLSGYIVACRDNRLLICRREDEQKIKDLVK